jgi:DHA2 family multidrug resistance protein
VLLYALSQGNAATNSDGWSAPFILLCFAISIIALAIFITHELTTKHPLIDLRLLADQNFGITNMVLFIFSMGMFGSTFLMPMYLQNSLGYTAFQAGLVFMPVGIIQGLISPLAGILSSKINAKIPLITGIGLMFFSFYMNSDLSFLTEHNYIMTSLYIRGFGMGLAFTPLSTVSLLTIPKEKMAQASSITNTVRQIGGSIGVAIFSTVLTSRINFHTQIFGNAIQSGSQEYKNVIMRLAHDMQVHGGGAISTAVKQGQSILLSNLSKQAYIQAIDDDFLLAAGITLLGIIPILFLRTKKKNNQQTNTSEVYEAH